MQDALPILILPGLGGSGPAHWQSLWQAARPDYIRVEQQDWDRPDLEAWTATLDHHIAGQNAPPILVAHSLACALVAHWVARGNTRIRGALLVAPADVDSDAHTPPETRSFRPMPLRPFPCPTIVVASADDPFVDITRARHFARAWGARLVEIGKAGHINSNSGLGAWPQGQQILAEMLRLSAVLRP